MPFSAGVVSEWREIHSLPRRRERRTWAALLPKPQRLLASARVLLQSRQILRRDKETNGARLPRLSFDEPIAFQGLDHIVDRRRGDPEIVLQVRLRWRAAVDLGVVVDECQILTLFCGEWRCHGRVKFRRRINAYLEGLLAKTFDYADLEDVDLSADHRANGLFGGGVEIRAQLFRIVAGGLEIRDPCARVIDLGERPLPSFLALRLKRLRAE
jgi:hypothetical protein